MINSIKSILAKNSEISDWIIQESHTTQTESYFVGIEQENFFFHVGGD